MPFYDMDGKSDASPRFEKPSLAKHQVKANSEFRRKMVQNSNPYRHEYQQKAAPIQSNSFSKIFGGLNSDESFTLDQSQVGDQERAVASS